MVCLHSVEDPDRMPFHSVIDYKLWANSKALPSCSILMPFVCIYFDVLLYFFFLSLFLTSDATPNKLHRIVFGSFRQIRCYCIGKTYTVIPFFLSLIVFFIFIFSIFHSRSEYANAHMQNVAWWRVVKREYEMHKNTRLKHINTQFILSRVARAYTHRQTLSHTDTARNIHIILHT